MRRRATASSVRARLLANNQRTMDRWRELGVDETALAGMIATGETIRSGAPVEFSGWELPGRADFAPHTRYRLEPDDTVTELAPEPEVIPLDRPAVTPGR